VLEQSLPWEVEVLVIAPGSSDADKTLSNSNVRVVHVAEGSKPGETMDRVVSEAAGEFVVFLNDDLKPHDNRWLVGLTDPLFDDSSVGVVTGSVIDAGSTAPEGTGTTYHRHDGSDDRFDISLNAFAVRQSVAAKNRFSAMYEDPKGWMENVMSAGYNRRAEPSLAVERIQAAQPAPAKAPRSVSSASNLGSTSKETSSRQHNPYVEESIEQEMLLWQLPLAITKRTFERYLEIALDKHQRDVKSVILAPMDATREILTTYTDAKGIPFPSFLRK